MKALSITLGLLLAGTSFAEDNGWHCGTIQELQFNAKTNDEIHVTIKTAKGKVVRRTIDMLYGESPSVQYALVEIHIEYPELPLCLGPVTERSNDTGVKLLFNFDQKKKK